MVAADERPGQYQADALPRLQACERRGCDDAVRVPPMRAALRSPRGEVWQRDVRAVCTMQARGEPRCRALCKLAGRWLLTGRRLFAPTARWHSPNLGSRGVELLFGSCWTHRCLGSGSLPPSLTWSGTVFAAAVRPVSGCAAAVSRAGATAVLLLRFRRSQHTSVNRSADRSSSQADRNSADSGWNPSVSRSADRSSSQADRNSAGSG
eukprot:COSAG01_NODE_6245_length_3772_cov_12.433433_8_plen_208_part_00